MKSPIKNKELIKKINELRELEGQLIDHMEEMYKKASHRKRMRMLKNYLQKNIRGKNFLDIGCAEGGYCDFAQKNKATKVIGIDISKSKIRKAKEKYPKCKFRVLDENNLNKLNENWDIILCSETLQHVVNYIDFVKKIKPILNKNAKLIITTPNLSTFEKHQFADINEKMDVEELLKEIGGGGFGKQNAVWKFNNTTLIKEIEKKCNLKLVERIPVDTPDGKIKELWSIMIFEKNI